MIADTHISLEIFAIDMLTAFKAVRVFNNLKAHPKQKRESAVHGREIWFICHSLKVTDVHYTYAGLAKFGGYCWCLTTTVHILYRVPDLERAQLFETVNWASVTYERGQIFEAVNRT